jgi:hypothetical protein
MSVTESELTEDQVIEAVGQMLVQCELKMAPGAYEAVSARSILRELGYEGEKAYSVLLFIAEGGFDYCLDHEIAMTGHHEARHEYPDHNVCYWGPDQLESRLRCLSNLPPHIRYRR